MAVSPLMVRASNEYCGSIRVQYRLRAAQRTSTMAAVVHAPSIHKEAWWNSLVKIDCGVGMHEIQHNISVSRKKLQVSCISHYSALCEQKEQYGLH